MTTDPAVWLRPARPDEVAALSQLALRSKGVWGYSPAFMEACSAELTLGVEDLARLEVVVAESPAGLLGFYSLAFEGRHGEVVHFFVDPPAIGTGVGPALWRHLTAAAAELGLVAVTIDADPNAADFYLAMGATRNGRSPSGSIPGRTLPRLRHVVTTG